MIASIIHLKYLLKSSVIGPFPVSCLETFNRRELLQLRIIQSELRKCVTSVAELPGQENKYKWPV